MEADVDRMEFVLELFEQWWWLQDQDVEVVVDDT